VIGVNTAVAGIGLGLAVPIDATTRRIVASLMADGRVRRAFLGIVGGARPLPAPVAQRVGRPNGLEVVQLLDGSPAAAAGLRAGDVIVELDGTPVTGVADLQRLLAGGSVGRAVPVRAVRGDRFIDLVAHPTELAA
jgi:serine protease Do